MRRIFASARVAFFLGFGAAPVLIASGISAHAQLLDPGWQVVYSGQSRYSVVGGGGSGLISSMFADGAGMMAVGGVYPPAPTYYQPMPQVYRPAPMYYLPVPAPQTRVYQAPAAYYQQVPAQQTRAYQPAPVYYQPVPAPQTRAYQAAPVYYQQMPAQPVRALAQSPSYSQQAPAQQTRGNQASPQYTSGIPPQPTAAQPTAQPAPASQPRGVFMMASGAQGAPQTTAPSNPSAPATRLAWGQPAPQPAPPPQQSWGQPAPQPAPAPPQQSWGQPAPQPAPAPPQQQAWGQPAPQPAPALQLRSFFPSGTWGVPPSPPPPAYAPSEYGDMARPMVDPKYDRQVIDYKTDEPPGTIIVDTPHYFLYLVMEGGRAMRYGIGVGREGFTWTGESQISAMREWPEWRPPNEMLERRPDLPRYVSGGLDNPLGARALYLGATLYRIHGSNEPWSIGTRVSSGCIRLRNEDIIDLYGRVKIGAKVIVL
jgi:lipoprotein-anchoring transpeptidase ErfK/SrfK